MLKHLNFHLSLILFVFIIVPLHAQKKSYSRGWIITLVWFFFAIGPGCVIGNTIFGDPAKPATWANGIPSIWIWQSI